MKKTLTIAAIAATMGTLSASAQDLVAGWESFAGSSNFAPTQTALGTTANIVGTTVASTNWDQWNNTGLADSSDTTFGSFAGATAAVDDSNLALSRSDGTLAITLTNNSGLDQTMHGFHFDAAHKNNNSATTWALSFSGAISGTAITDQSLALGDLDSLTPAARDTSIDLSIALSDSVWEAGQDITFTWTFTGSSNEGTSNGNELQVDNIGVTVAAVPEPSTYALLGGLFALSFVAMRRRK